MYMKWMRLIFLLLSIVSASVWASTPVLQDIKGTLEIRIADAFKLHQTEYQYLLHTKNQTYYLIFAGKTPPRLATDMVLHVKTAATVKDHAEQIIVKAHDIQILKSPQNKIHGPIGVQSLIVFLVNFQDQPTVKPFTKEQIQQIIFGTVNDYHKEYSFGLTSYAGIVLDWRTVSMASTTECSSALNILRDMAPQLAAQAGVDLNQYKRRMFVFPTLQNCRGFGGWGNVGGEIAYAWINGFIDPFVFSHEMGHNLGLWHANGWRCSNYSSDQNCTRAEYGNLSDNMGLGRGHFNSYLKETIGWLNTPNTPPIQTVTTSGIYTIYPYAPNDRKVKALKILRKSLPDGSKDYYYIEFRQPVGFDSTVAPDYTRGILILRGNTLNTNSSDIFDLTPNDNDFNTVSLKVGQTYEDPLAANGGLRITLNAFSTASAQVNVVIGSGTGGGGSDGGCDGGGGGGGDGGGGGETCTRANPSLTIDPNTLQWVNRGGSLSSRLTIKNNDSAACSASTFQMNAQASNSNITNAFSTNPVSLAPGASTTVALTTSVTQTIPLGTYSVLIMAMNKDATTYLTYARNFVGVR